MTPAKNSPFSPTERMLRQFGALWIVFLGGFALLQEFRFGNHTTALVVGALALTVGPLGIVAPRAIRPVYLACMFVAFPIGWIVSRVVLALIYFGLFTPIALYFRATGRDALGLKRKPDAGTYWQTKPKPTSDAQYLRQF